MGLLGTFNKIGMNVLTGRTPYTSRQFNVVNDHIHINHASEVEQCLGIINRKLIGRDYQADCNFNYLTIGAFDAEVVEEALEIMRTKGGWANTTVKQIPGGWSIEIH